MRVLVWHVHGGWMHAFLRGEHEYLIPHDGGQAPPITARSRLVPPGRLRDEPVDIVVLQRLEEFELVERLLGRRAGRDVAAVFVEHNTPSESPVEQRHPLAERTDIPIIHVTHLNRLLWDNGRAPTRVIEHGIPDAGSLYTGELASLGVVINEPVRRWRMTGTDLLPRFAESAPIDAFGIDGELLPAALGLPEDRLRFAGNLDATQLHAELARRRAYLHPMRWTSLGLSLLEAMSLGMPVLVLATTEAPRAVPPEAGAISTDVDELCAMARRLMNDREEARMRGAVARAAVRERYGLERFLRDWDAVLAEYAEERRPLRTRRRSPARAPRSR
jgi:hypothetical protein